MIEGENILWIELTVVTAPPEPRFEFGTAVGTAMIIVKSVILRVTNSIDLGILK